MYQNDLNLPLGNPAQTLKRRRVWTILLSTALLAFFAAVTCYLGAQEASPEEIEQARQYLNTGRFRDPVPYSMQHSYRTNREQSATPRSANTRVFATSPGGETRTVVAEAGVLTPLKGTQSIASTPVYGAAPTIAEVPSTVVVPREAAHPKPTIPVVPVTAAATPKISVVPVTPADTATAKISSVPVTVADTVADTKVSVVPVTAAPPAYQVASQPSPVVEPILEVKTATSVSSPVAAVAPAASNTRQWTAISNAPPAVVAQSVTNNPAPSVAQESPATTQPVVAIAPTPEAVAHPVVEPKNAAAPVPPVPMPAIAPEPVRPNPPIPTPPAPAPEPVASRTEAEARALARLDAYRSQTPVPAPVQTPAPGATMPPIDYYSPKSPTANEPWRQEIVRVETRLLETKGDSNSPPSVPAAPNPVVSVVPNPAPVVVPGPSPTPAPVLATISPSAAPQATPPPAAVVVTASSPVPERAQPDVLPEVAAEPTFIPHNALRLRPPATTGPKLEEPNGTPSKSVVMKTYQPAPKSGWAMAPEIEVRAREILRSRLTELGLTGEPAPAATVIVLTPPDVNAAPISEESLPPGKREKLKVLLRSYIADNISPLEYHTERARIIAEP